ncbi:hypothetical protein [Methanobrevibacter smithii]|mgnify:FL=1|uniref:hypothetical protein n=1 Tax=Methanobrevibacter smithii TaxID=2173 RepID=UPI0037DCF532
MLTLTDSSNLAFELSSTEAMLSKHEFITEDFLFIGIFSLDKAIKLIENKSSEKIQKDSDSIKNDYEEINNIIKKFNLDFETIRTELKAIVGNGDFKLKCSIIHMDQNCMNVCDKATQMELLTQHFRPEFVNRIDEVVQFRELDENDFESLVNLCIDDISKRVLSDKNIKIEYGDNVSKYLASQGFNKNFGVRYLNRSVEEQIEYSIADLIINEELKSGDTLRISASKKGLEFMPIKE